MKGIQNTTTNNFSTIVGNNKKFIVPKFQRDYSWNSEQWDDLWQDIETMISNEEDHYMGYLVMQTTDDKTYYIIDGQQRFTTITLLILAAIKCIKTIAKGSDEDGNAKRVENLLSTYIGKEDPVSLVYDNILVLNRNNDPYYRDYIVKLENLRVRNLKATEKLMKRCFDFLEQKLKDRYKSGKEYAQFIQYVVDNLYFTEIIVTDELNAFRVFETLNARGVQLSSSDLLKNYLFSLVDAEKSHGSHIEILESKWTQLTSNIKTEKVPEFLRYYWNTSHKSIRANAVFKTIRQEIKTDKMVFRLMDDMLIYSDVYMALTDEHDDLWADQEISHYIALLRLFKLKQPFSLLMSGWVNLKENEFKKLLKTVITICFRYNIISDKNPNDQETPFNNMAMYISENKSVNISLLNSIVVKDNEFENAFREKSFPYNSNNAKILRYILGKIEHFKGSKLDIQYDDENATIEHVLPRDYDETWGVDEDKASRLVYRIGNTCLLERTDNRDLGNVDFKTKKEQYAKSSYYYAKYIANNYDVWDENSINKIQTEMAKAAKSIWRINT